jgi:hypothetical protein
MMLLLFHCSIFKDQLRYLSETAYLVYHVFTLLSTCFFFQFLWLYILNMKALITGSLLALSATALLSSAHRSDLISLSPKAI